MLISTKGRYALRVMLDLAEHKDEGYISMKSVAQRQGFSLKYIQSIMLILSKNDMILGVHGKGGGYKLSKELKEYKVGDILRLIEGDIVPVNCLKSNSAVCSMKDSCYTLPMWKKFADVANDFFDNITLEDLINRKI